MIVADTNLISYLLIDGYQTDTARAVREKDPVWMAPPLWRSEFLNVLATMVRLERMDVASALAAWELGLDLLRRREAEPQGRRVLMASAEYGISAYDAQFVVTASDLGVPLVTWDRTLVERCPGSAVSAAGF